VTRACAHATPHRPAELSSGAGAALVADAGGGLIWGPEDRSRFSCVCTSWLFILSGKMPFQLRGMSTRN
jgi:hypothetical protein